MSYVERGFKKRRKKQCMFCKDKITTVDYKNLELLKKFTNDKGKILSGRISGTCAKHQRKVSQAIKRARNIALLPYVAEQE
ncbi:MAG: 30S ribosomal protein S18 [Fusobacteria bacterium]|nr:30S ribosomal protein S18 [Fusobacteriota bacterium]